MPKLYVADVDDMAEGDYKAISAFVETSAEGHSSEQTDAREVIWLPMAAAHVRSDSSVASSNRTASSLQTDLSRNDSATSTKPVKAPGPTWLTPAISADLNVQDMTNLCGQRHSSVQCLTSPTHTHSPVSQNDSRLSRRQLLGTVLAVL